MLGVRPRTECRRGASTQESRDEAAGEGSPAHVADPERNVVELKGPPWDLDA